MAKKNQRRKVSMRAAKFLSALNSATISTISSIVPLIVIGGGFDMVAPHRTSHTYHN